MWPGYEWLHAAYEQIHTPAARQIWWSHREVDGQPTEAMMTTAERVNAWLTERYGTEGDAGFADDPTAFIDGLPSARAENDVRAEALDEAAGDYAAGLADVYDSFGRWLVDRAAALRSGGAS